MNVFNLRNQLIREYSDYVRSFFAIRDPQILAKVEEEFASGILWPEVLIQLNPTFRPGRSVEQLVADQVLHPKCAEVFRAGKSENDPVGKPMTLHLHQDQAIIAAGRGENYVLTTGTGSGKSLSYIIPIVDHVLRTGSGKGIKAIVVYPMNALANSQQGELEKFLNHGFNGRPPVTFKRYTGQEKGDERNAILQNPPDILLTNYVMLELILTRYNELDLVRAAKGLRFLVFDELHTYRGRQGADVALLIRRLREQMAAHELLCVGTSATMGGAGGPAAQRKVVAEVGSLLFGSEVKESNVIGESLVRLTGEMPATGDDLAACIRTRNYPTDDVDSFKNHPLARWVETTFGLRQMPDTNEWVRALPRPISGEKGAAHDLHLASRESETDCAEAIRATLLAGAKIKIPPANRPAFAFRLHQFISKGGNVYVSIEPAGDRYVTLNAQQFKPNDRSKALFPLVFCRECGQEYYCIKRTIDANRGEVLEARDLGDLDQESETSEAGFAYFTSEIQWPDDALAQIDFVPEEWTEKPQSGSSRIRSARSKHLPETIHVTPDGSVVNEGKGLRGTFLPAPFRFCPCCGVAYDFRQRSDIAKLTSLGTEGRSTATTILSVFTLIGLESESVAARARKLLSFTDNRQDASLQAGHYNDFVEIGLLRSALFKAALSKGDAGLEHQDLALEVFRAMNLPFDLYALDSTASGLNKKQTETALREVIAYRLYRDLKRGWRVIMPNLEQCGLLNIDYLTLADECANESNWQNRHEALAGASPQVREKVCRTLLDFMRRGLAIHTESLDYEKQEAIRRMSFARLREPWAIGEGEKMEHGSILFPCSSTQGDSRENIFLPARGGFGLYLRRPGTFPEAGQINVESAEAIIADLLDILHSRLGILERVREPDDRIDVPGYRLKADAIVWKAGDGRTPHRDRIRMPRMPESGGRTNSFFVRFYKEIAIKTSGTEAHEHTAQVPSDERQEYEIRFRKGAEPGGLQLLYCSPTMELGIDISELNVVNMRNVPPTPANYAQRSGRAGRSGQPALVFSYCTIGNAHDQYFFRRPELMVAGSVHAPRIDLTNQDLVRAHIYAIWLSEAKTPLSSSMAQILDTSTDTPSLKIVDSVRADLDNPHFRTHAKERAWQALKSLEADLKATDWWHDEWLNDTLNRVTETFEAACDRWRGLYRSALSQSKECQRIILDASKSQFEKDRATALRREAENQIALLTDTSGALQSDFYTYRYLASEGFLPGYNFPRLPLSAFIPGRRTKQEKDEYLSRPRFLAISEFGPQSLVYHAGSKYQIVRAILPVTDDLTLTQKAKICASCGYLHWGGVVETLDTCDHCKESLPSARNNLFRMQNVSTRRRERINSDEEERFRQGYDVISGLRFPERDGQISCRSAEATGRDGARLFTLAYGDTATLWRINLGWRRRKETDPDGFLLNMENGNWERSKVLDEDDENLGAGKVERVVPFVEDRRNALVIVPASPLDEATMATLQAAFKQAIQLNYQLEDQELAAEPLPAAGNRQRLLYYEAAEGGAGVLRRLVDDPNALAGLARTALELMHYDPVTGANNGKLGAGGEGCEAACYDCLLSYGNQRDHKLIDRSLVKDLLMNLVQSQTRTSGGVLPRADHYQALLTRCESELEKKWLGAVHDHGFRLPSAAQELLRRFKTRPDFFYKEHSVAIYVDGPHHEFPDRKKRDEAQTDLLEDHGIRVVRFAHYDDWNAIFTKYAYLFGTNS